MKLSEMTLADLVALKQELNYNWCRALVTEAESYATKANLIKAEIDKRIEQIDFNN